jgi:hypothetical protein
MDAEDVESTTPMDFPIVVIRQRCRALSAGIVQQRLNRLLAATPQLGDF